jgi:molybdenum cofactor synthesis domain-containing protein
LRYKSACIVSIGTELVRGIVQDTNSSWIASRLVELGFDIKRIVIVPDELGEIKWALISCLEVGDVVITTGGLGFTSDDITLQGASEALGSPLVLSEEALEMIKSKVGQVEPRYLKAAYLPRGSRPLYNRVGISPGVHIVLGNKNIFILPGVPVEMKAVFEDHVVNILSRQSSLISRKLHIKTQHMIEAEVDHVLEKLRNKYRWAYLKTHAKRPVEISVVIYANDPQELDRRTKELIDDLSKEIKVSCIDYL